jgi:hypothetical protein
MIDLNALSGAHLLGGFVIVSVSVTAEPFLDSLGRPVIAQTRIAGRKFHITLLYSADDKECSVSTYHEVLEAMTVASENPPSSVIDFNEADFERAGYQAYEQFGAVTPESLNRMLQFYGFQGE